MASLLSMGGGAKQGLDDYLARLLMEDKLAEEQRSNMATEDYRNRALDSNSEDRRLAREQMERTKGEQDWARDASVAARAAEMRPSGADVSEREFGFETSHGVPGSIYDTPRSVPATQMDPEPEFNPPAPSVLRKFKGTKATQASDQRADQAESNAAESERRAREAERDRDANIALRGKTENRLESYGAPVVQTQTPEGVRLVPRGSESVQSGGAAPPLPAPERQAIDDLGGFLQLAKSTLEEGKRSGWSGIGVPGAVGGMLRDFVGTDTGGGAQGKMNRTNLRELETFAFAEGGKQLTGTEKEMVKSFLSNYLHDPKVAEEELARFITSLERRIGAKSSTIPNGGPTAPVGGPKRTRYDLNGNIIPE